VDSALPPSRWSQALSRSPSPTAKSGTITVPVGTTVVWENNDDIPHTVVSLDGTFRSQALDTEDKFSFTFDKAGMFDYLCSLHPHTKGQVFVTPWMAKRNGENHRMSDERSHFPS
jgi:hypothetical protein